VLELQVSKSKCLECGRQSRPLLPGILRCQRARLKRQFSDPHAPRCPPVLGIDHHVLRSAHSQSVRLVLGRSEAALESYLERLEGNANVRLICMHRATRRNSSCLADEIAAIWHFTRNNRITEGFHNKMELISRQAYSFREFESYLEIVSKLQSA
jgi:hypothetical protein